MRQGNSGAGPQTPGNFRGVAFGQHQTKSPRQIAELAPDGNCADIFFRITLLERVDSKIVFPIQILLHER